jgi:Asp-tRNA(Asn)/Glu-tRNA(Gln) amidotransferase B subunit
MIKERYLRKIIIKRHVETDDEEQVSEIMNEIINNNKLQEDMIAVGKKWASEFFRGKAPHCFEYC